ncbi:MAG: hypothetical protein DRP68_03070 [Candidatus Omnitrophota bacterium]|nr:MAG: hypothetical protein DRP68_03070 [Candidatus Omnitrophota bacterium]RKY39151.1 MAG: hypothetical protein DRP72_00405 [Candidatus Omnitrophota bacterium]RKY45814.1 MAG: hypothetical protein DRP81_02665 [Candidatus Omnitrophota bacterium]
MEIRIDAHLRKLLPKARFAWAEFKNVTIKSSPPQLIQLIEKEKDTLSQLFTISTLATDKVINISRMAFKKVGTDPARYRPAQEALIRRILQNKGIPFINNAVDINNYLSIKYRTPMGIYNQSVLDNVLTIGVGEEETFVSLSGRIIHCKNKIILKNQNNEVVGSPFVDSLKAKVDKNCTRLLHLVYLWPPWLKEEDFQYMKASFLNFLGGTASGYHYLPEEK